MIAEDSTDDRVMRGILAVLVADRSERESEPRIPTENLLYGVGFSYQEIGQMIGDKPDTVRKRISRAADPQQPKRASK
jgi:DNA-directed RNA polymerase specialized sigma24 family protein